MFQGSYTGLTETNEEQLIGKISRVYLESPILRITGASPVDSGKESACNAGDPVLIPVGKIPWRRKWQPTPVCLPEKFHGQSSLVGYSSWGRKELGTTQQLNSNSSSVKRRAETRPRSPAGSSWGSPGPLGLLHYCHCQGMCTLPLLFPLTSTHPTHPLPTRMPYLICLLSISHSAGWSLQVGSLL